MLLAFRRVYIVRLFHHPANLSLRVLMAQPIRIAAITPLGQVLLADGVPVKFFPQDFLYFGQGIQPVDELLASPAVVQAVIELFANVFWQAGDFSVTSFHKSKGQGSRVEGGR